MENRVMNPFYSEGSWEDKLRQDYEKRYGSAEEKVPGSESYEEKLKRGNGGTWEDKLKRDYEERYRGAEKELGETALDAVEIGGDDKSQEAVKDGEGVKPEGEEVEKTRDEMLEELKGREAYDWLNGVVGDMTVKEFENLSDEEVKDLYGRWLEHKNKGAEKGEEKKTAAKEPLVAVSLDRTRDAEAAARDIAERMLKEDLAEGKGFKKTLKKIWMGNIARGYFVERNRKLAYEQILAKQEGNESNLSDNEWTKYSQATIDRFIADYRREGEVREVVSDGEEVGEAKELIRRYVDNMTSISGNLPEDEKSERREMFEASFADEMKRLMVGEGDTESGVVMNNYLDLAKNVMVRLEHESDIEKVLKGFQLVRGEARTGVRSEAHLKGIDKLMNKYEHSALGKFVPVELVAGAASIATWMAASGSKKAMWALGFGVGGMALSGVVGGLKESARVKVDRAQMMQERASGMKVDTSSEYVKALEETLYSMMPATELTKGLKDAMEQAGKDDEGKMAVMKALAQVETRIKMSDTEGIDAICYSDPDKSVIEREFWELAQARAEAKVWLKSYKEVPEGENNAEEVPEGENNAKKKMGWEAVLGQLVDVNRKALGEEITAKDELFNKLKTRQVVKYGVAVGTFAGAFGAVMQEVVATFSPDVYGVKDLVMEKLGAGVEAANLGVNNPDAHNTAVAGLLGMLPGVDGAPMEMGDVMEAANQSLSLEEVEDLRSQGFTVIEETNSIVQNQEIDLTANEYAERYGTEVSREGWAESGGSASYTANGEGIVTNVTGEATTYSGETIDLRAAAENGQIKAFVSLTEGSQSMPIEVTGQIVNDGGQIEFIPEPGSAAAECFENGQFVGKYFEVVYDSGVGEDGVHDVITLSTVVGEGMDGEMLTGTVPMPVEETTYNVISFGRPTEAVQVFGDGFAPNPAAVLPFVRREDLRAARVPEAAPTVGAATAEATGASASASEQTAGSEANENTEPQAEQTGEAEPVAAGEYDAEGKPIWDNLAGKIGGEQGVKIVNGELDAMQEEEWRNILYQNWWENLSTEMKDRFAGRGGERLSPVSNTLSEWLSSTGKMAGAEEITSGEGENAAP